MDAHELRLRTGPLKQNKIENYGISTRIDAEITTAKEAQKFPSFHEVLGPILTVGQLFGNLPASNLLDHDWRNIEFKWKTFKAIYSMAFLLLGSFEVGLMITKGFRKGFDILYAELIMFYGYSVAQSFIFFYFATKWREIMGFWYRKEKAFLQAPYKRFGRISLTMRVRLIGVLFIILFLTEHLMFVGMELHDNYYQLKFCNVTNFSFLNNYMRRERPHLLDILPYRWWIFPLFQWTITCLAFSWNYVDFFIIILSVGLSTRFNQLNLRLRHTPNQQKDHKFWLEIRLHYTELVDLLQYTDDRISALILLSMSHNLFLICTKTFEAVKSTNRPFLINNIYFYWYLFALIFRTLFVLYTCSSVHSASSYPLIAIREAPSSHWSINVRLSLHITRYFWDMLKRLSDLLQSENISLSGNKFFYITRQLILAMIGTIVTFELVLFDRGSRPGDEPICAFF